MAFHPIPSPPLGLLLFKASFPSLQTGAPRSAAPPSVVEAPVRPPERQLKEEKSKAGQLPPRPRFLSLHKELGIWPLLSLPPPAKRAPRATLFSQGRRQGSQGTRCPGQRSPPALKQPRCYYLLCSLPAHFLALQAAPLPDAASAPAAASAAISAFPKIPFPVFHHRASSGGRWLRRAAGGWHWRCCASSGRELCARSRLRKLAGWALPRRTVSATLLCTFAGNGRVPVVPFSGWKDAAGELRVARSAERNRFTVLLQTADCTSQYKSALVWCIRGGAV